MTVRLASLLHVRCPGKTSGRRMPACPPSETGYTCKHCSSREAEAHKTVAAITPGSFVESHRVDVRYCSAYTVLYNGMKR